MVGQRLYIESLFYNTGCYWHYLRDKFSQSLLTMEVNGNSTCIGCLYVRPTGGGYIYAARCGAIVFIPLSGNARSLSRDKDKYNPHTFFIS